MSAFSEIPTIALNADTHERLLTDGLGTRRCAVPACSWTTGGMTSAANDGRLLWLVGIWDHCLTADGHAIDSFALLLSDRSGSMPIALEAQELRLWLHGRHTRDHLEDAVRLNRFKSA